MDDSKLFDSVLGYLNFSEGVPNPTFQRNVNLLYERFQDGPSPHVALLDALETQLERRKGAATAFNDISQAAAVIANVRDRFLIAYRRHHRDLLAHLSDEKLFQPFLLARIFETVLGENGPWDEVDRIVDSAMRTLNDFVGHRPVATLENDRKLQPYPHERVRPIPVYLREAGIAAGPYRDLIKRTLEVLAAADPDVLASSYLDLELLDELALDPRAFDHSHPVNNRPGYQFGEWDPHCLDSQGRYRRLVLRPMILDALLAWMKDVSNGGEISEAVRWEAAVALGGTIVLASGVSGDRPETHDSETSLANLVPKIARCRDAFYRSASQRFLGVSTDPTQPFGAVRQHLNRFIARQRANQVQQDILAFLYARMGYPEESRKQASQIDTPSLRMRTEIQILLTIGRQGAEKKQLDAGEAALPEILDLLHRAIECGAIVDPWNILGFQGNFSVFRAMQDSIEDPRVDQLLALMDQIFDLHAQLLKAAAAQGEVAVEKRLQAGVLELAQWWDQFATYEVSDVPRLKGAEQAGSALFVARALSLWRQSGGAAGDVAFWNQHSHEFTTPRAYELVIEALLERNDLVASRALLMHWLSQAEDVPLEEGASSFFDLMLQWMRLCATLSVTPADQRDGDAVDVETLVAKLFDYMEANAGSFWSAPTFGRAEDEAPLGQVAPDELFAAAYEDVVFRDSADDGQEGAIHEGAGSPDDLLAEQAAELKLRLTFLQMRARLEQIASTMKWSDESLIAPLRRQWARHAETTKRQLLLLVEGLHAYAVNKPLGSQDSIIEFDRLESTKYEILMTALATAVETAHAQRFLCGAGADPIEGEDLQGWEKAAIELHRALRQTNPAEVRHRLVDFLQSLSSAPLLYVPLDKGGDPLKLFESRYVRDVMKQAAVELPGRGMFRETYHLLQTAQVLEQQQIGLEQQVTEFSLLFPVGFAAVIENLVDAIETWPGGDDDELAATWVSPIVERFSRLWIEHSSGVQYGELDRVADVKSWKRTVKFIQSYGRDLFTQGFMAFGNLRGIIRQGVDGFLERLVAENDPYRPLRIVEDLLDGRLDRKEAASQLSFIIRAVLENYEVYQDYNATTTQSDYGENLHLLLEILRVLNTYERRRWGLEPAYIAHSILARRGRLGVASLLEQAFVDEVDSFADALVSRLQTTQKRCGIYLASVEERISERFVRPLRVNRLLALVKPCMKTAETRQAPAEFDALLSLVEDFKESAPGAGIDAQHWLDEFGEEVDRVFFAEQEPDVLTSPPRPAKPLSLDEFQKQLSQWNRHLGRPRKGR